MSISHTFKSTSDLSLTTSAFSQMSRRAQALSITSTDGQPWSVQVNSAAITLFRGNNFSLRNAGYDEIYAIPNTVSVPTTAPSGTPQLTYTYEISTGRPLQTGFVRLVNTVTNTARTLTINSHGIISY